MKIVGRRFWTWMSVWALTFFVKGDLTAGPQERGAGQVTDGTSNTKHKVPLLKTQSSLKTQSGLKTQDRLKTTSNLKTQVFPKTQSGLKSLSGLKSQSGLKTRSGLKTQSIPGVGKVAKTRNGRR
jgi:hypothetical protein